MLSYISLKVYTNFGTLPLAVWFEYRLSTFLVSNMLPAKWTCIIIPSCFHFLNIYGFTTIITWKNFSFFYL